MYKIFVTGFQIYNQEYEIFYFFNFNFRGIIKFEMVYNQRNISRCFGFLFISGYRNYLHILSVKIYFNYRVLHLEKIKSQQELLLLKQKLRYNNNRLVMAKKQYVKEIYRYYM